jgi:rubrerythrin
MLAGKGFKEIYNLSGGFRAWKAKAAFGPEDKGLELFSGKESLERTLVVAYSLEAGLREFYVSMAAKVNNPDAQDLFQKLSEIEIKHQERIFSEYAKMTESSETKADFEKNIVSQAVEGGLTTGEYINRFNPDWESAIDIVELAMSIEAQALDLYQRASESSSDPQAQKALVQIADEERAHLVQLGNLIDTL